MRSPRIAISPETQGFPEPSMILPFLMMTSYTLLGLSCAKTVKVRQKVNSRTRMALTLLIVLFMDCMVPQGDEACLPGLVVARLKAMPFQTHSRNAPRASAG